MSNEILHFKCRWPENPVPNGAPSWLHYEVIEATDVVTRTVDLYSDGNAIRNSIELAEREGPDQRAPEFRSLVHGSFLEYSREGLIPITKSEFCSLWDNARDKPWPHENE
tara:strand:- start:798 stop:1127 length:330 start_codon:yes stop_codon:yes gene_type:complete